MFVRHTRVKRGDKVYEYAQLVESFRQENGKPTHRVIASLKDWTPEAIENLKQALTATKAGAKLITAEPVRPDLQVTEAHHQVLENLAYLPIAVFDRLWRHWGLSSLLDRILPSQSICCHSDVLRALVLHRCVAPGSKLSACRWYPTTALPELLGVKAHHFNNTRVHRALDELSKVDAQLQADLAGRLLTSDEGVLVTYLDLTDTWFVGSGPEMSRKGKTKEGLYREKIGIALLCDQRGFPLCWQVVEGGRYEPPVMLDVLQKAVENGILTGQPVVMDRAMGRGVHLEELTDAGISFVTALGRQEFQSYVDNGPWQHFGDVQVSGSERTRGREVERLGQLALDAGMSPIAGGRYVVDLGIARCERGEAVSPMVGQEPLAELLRELDSMQEALDTGAAESVSVLADWYGVSPATIYRYRRLLELGPELRDHVLAGRTGSLRLEELSAIASLPVDDQLAAFEVKMEEIGSQDRERPKPPVILDIRRKNLMLRRVVCFTPELLIRRQQTARKRVQRLKSWVEEVNKAQRKQVRPRSPTTLHADARTMLEAQHALTLFEVTTRVHRAHGREHHELVLTRKDAAWKRRRALDGFSVLVASPFVRRTAGDLVDLYFSKDVVEKDFQVIKSEIDLRPVRHRTDPKVQAHVTLCMLALLLRRTLEQRLAGTATPITASTATSTLATCHLNRLCADGGDAYYTVTRATPDQHDLLAALSLSELLDDAVVGGRLKPR